MPPDSWQLQTKTLEPPETASSPDSETPQDQELLRIKRGHVLTELLETERFYVSELGSVIKVSP